MLDVNRDDYLCVGRQKFESLGPWLHGWEASSEDPKTPDASQMPAHAAELAKELLNAEILSEGPENTKDARVTRLEPATCELTSAVPVPAGKWRWYHVPIFFLSSVMASVQLRICPLRSTISYVAARKERALRRQRRQGGKQIFDLERARILVEAFEALRPWYWRPYVCTFDCLDLLNFLAWYGLFPEWVFGVTAEPFKAHCWLRSGRIVINDTRVITDAFMPIMRV